jgi:hypothetical protein
MAEKKVLINMTQWMCRHKTATKKKVIILNNNSDIFFGRFERLQCLHLQGQALKKEIILAHVP